MARTVKPEEFAAKRREILDAAHRLVFTKGFERMSIQNILDELQISSGAFHHYFGSREALLDAYIERIKEESDKMLTPVIKDPRLNAIQKLQSYFDTLDRGRVALSAEIARIWDIWYTDANALVRLRVDEAVFAQRAPIITEIVRQGVREGLFSLSHPEKAGEVILSLVQAMENKHGALLRSVGQGDSAEIVSKIIATHTAYMEAIERVLGAPPNCLARTDAAAVERWVSALQHNDKT